ncbi:tRNA methyltransferase subunit [Cordyceps militaris]|uniref:tRNA (adenine(58)-N(1))-methyltransferase catalytic subunit TRM61 n=1 Tax=Cordyceps militaris TaxID=73501 RepID=A0A2H4SFU5_CORMI|nr:tRNA methyltransferase subunit [Cordyceps militaris]
MEFSVSPFLEPGERTKAGSLAIVSLARDDFDPLLLEKSSGAVDGYAEGATLNTRFGSFPHSTLLDIPWGSQVRASAVDTGSRGRKRRLETTDDDTPAASQDENSKAPVIRATVASSGFIYILRPSPELWTSSLPHRTQVVYTPDYSYILQRIRARPGTRIIEAGAGSGSFSHASARAVYNGYPKDETDTRGKVFSFEFNEDRFHKMAEEIESHFLTGIVQIQHRDVYRDGFLVDGKSPNATAIFLDLPAPWKALQHLSRRGGASPLDPKQSVHICTFSPCIEQVSRTVTELRTLGWTDVDMVEISQRRLNVTRERVGVNMPNERGNTQTPADVLEAVTKLRKVNQQNQKFQKAQLAQHTKTPTDPMDLDSSGAASDETPASDGKDKDDQDKPWMQGRLIHRSESDLKTHTSYLVFAVLPPEWTDEDEAKALAKWPCGQESKVIGNVDKESRKREKREMLASRTKKRKVKGKQLDAQTEKRKTDNDTQAESESTLGRLSKCNCWYLVPEIVHCQLVTPGRFLQQRPAHPTGNRINVSTGRSSPGSQTAKSYRGHSLVVARQISSSSQPRRSSCILYSFFPPRHLPTQPDDTPPSMTSTIGIPIKLLNEAQGHIITLEITSGQTYRGKLLEAEDNMNVQLKDITVTARDGRVSHLDQVYIRGSHVRFFIVPDMLRNAPMFRSSNLRGRGVGMARGRATVSRARAGGRGGAR